MESAMPPLPIPPVYAKGKKKPMPKPPMRNLSKPMRRGAGRGR